MKWYGACDNYEISASVSRYVSHTTSDASGYPDLSERAFAASRPTESREAFDIHSRPASACAALGYRLALRALAFLKSSSPHIKRSAYTSVAHLEACLKEYVEIHNKASRRFVWTKPTDEDPAKIERAKKALPAHQI